MNLNNLISLENGFLVDTSNQDIYYLQDNLLVNTKNQDRFNVQENYIIDLKSGKIEFLKTNPFNSWSSYWINLIFTQDEQFYLMTEDGEYFIQQEDESTE